MRDVDQSAARPAVGISHRLAVWLMVASSAIMSLSGLLVRNIEAASDWQIVFWRAIALCLAMILILHFEHKGAALREMRRIGWSGVFGGLLFGGTIMGFVLALGHTTVANTVFTMSAIPFFTAVLAWVVLGESIRLVTGVAIVFALGGIALMVGDGLASGSMFGNLMAILTALGFAGFVVVLRKGRAVNMQPAIIIAALFAAGVAVIMTGGALLVTPRDLLLCVIWGAVITGASYFLMVTSSRSLQATELTLLVLLEFILAPVWVYLFVNEVPGQMTLIGGAVVVVAVAGHALLSKSI